MRPIVDQWRDSGHELWDSARIRVEDRRCVVDQFELGRQVGLRGDALHTKNNAIHAVLTELHEISYCRQAAGTREREIRELAVQPHDGTN